MLACNQLYIQYNAKRTLNVLIIAYGLASYMGSYLVLGLSNQDLNKHRGLVYHNNIVGTLKIHYFSSHIGQVLRLPGAVSLVAQQCCTMHRSGLR